MRIAENVEMLELKNETGALYPVLAWDENARVLIDTGLPGETEALRLAVQSAGFSLEGLTHVLVTHQDLDHIGSARALADMGVPIYAHEAETPYIRGEVQNIRLTDMESRLDEMSAEERAFYERAKMGAPLFYVPGCQPLKDGEVLPVCGGIKVMHTPGHTPGHMVLLLQQSSILVAGDAANLADGRLVGANPRYTRDETQAAASFESIKAAKAAAVVCYHGGLHHC